MNNQLCLFGEVLFDHFPDGQRILGGAPFNVAWNLRALGEPVLFISRVGNDPEGDAVRQAMQSWGMHTNGLQTDNTLPTGQVRVTLKDGEPSYDIVSPCAYDRIQPVTTACDCSILYHGTLALRDPVSRGALDALLKENPSTVFVDVNLRPPWWEKQGVTALLDSADWVKLNRQELELLCRDGAYSIASAQALIREHDLQGLLLTHGSEGAEVITATGEHHRVTPQATVEVVDAVGAGDAFASVFLLGLAHNWPLDLTLQRAQTFASALVAQRGATVADPTYYQKFTDTWNQAD